MMFTGTIYGVVLNDREELGQLEGAFHEDPYKAPPKAPVVYIKPRLCATGGGAPVLLPVGEEELVAAATLALLIGRDAQGVTPDQAWEHVSAASLALDVSLSAPNYYRPAIAQRCRDGFLPLGPASSPTMPSSVVTFINQNEVHRWSLSRLARSPRQLIADLSAFMTLRAGDLLLVGLPGDAPHVRAGQSIRVEADGLAPIETRVEEEKVQ